MKYYPTDKETDRAERYHERYGNLNAPDDVPWTYHIGRFILALFLIPVLLVFVSWIPTLEFNTVKEIKTGIVLCLLLTFVVGVCLRLAAKK